MECMQGRRCIQDQERRAASLSCAMHQHLTGRAFDIGFRTEVGCGWAERHRGDVAGFGKPGAQPAEPGFGICGQGLDGEIRIFIHRYAWKAAVEHVVFAGTDQCGHADLPQRRQRRIPHRGSIGAGIVRSGGEQVQRIVMQPLRRRLERNTGGRAAVEPGEPAGHVANMRPFGRDEGAGGILDEGAHIGVDEFRRGRLRRNGQAVKDEPDRVAVLGGIFEGNLGARVRGIEGGAFDAKRAQRGVQGVGEILDCGRGLVERAGTAIAGRVQGHQGELVRQTLHGRHMQPRRARGIVQHDHDRTLTLDPVMHRLVTNLDKVAGGACCCV